MRQSEHHSDRLPLVIDISQDTSDDGVVFSQCPGVFKILLATRPERVGYSYLLVIPPGKHALSVEWSVPVSKQLHIKEEAVLITRSENTKPFSLPLTGKAYHTSIDAGKAALLAALMDRILLAQQSSVSQERLLGLLKILFALVGRHYLHELQRDEPPEVRLFRRFNKLVGSEQYRKRSVSEYASALSVGVGSLNNALQKVSGMTASQIIDYHIICEAKRAVITTDYPMKKIAADLRFDDLAHFSKFFRVRSGMTYSNFKRAYAL